MSENLQFWISRQRWEECGEKPSPDIRFPDGPSLPLEPAEIDKHCAPYFSGFGPDAQPIPSFQALRASTALTEGMGLHPADRMAPLEQIYVCNPTSEPQPIGGCIDNGWWCTSFRIHALLPVEESPVTHTKHLDALLEKLGRPTRVETNGCFYEILAAGDGFLRYRLIYEYEHFTLAFEIDDVVSQMYGLSTQAVRSCIYYAAPMWASENSRQRWNLYYLFQQDQQAHPMPPHYMKGTP